MDLKISCVVLVAAACMSAAVANTGAPAPVPNSSITMPIVGCLVGASFVSFFAYYLH
ncbi:hypothetical protein SLEP1_g8603 [Rubroshorea leprosula]|uniref:Uncharacterized protein n=1 Tax=Rubroshorea leprosula TaxID=152421 RepID=A0AAV5I6R5_9ROSI|nr:hypothetical protein SLEP1_g8603 [Rubroshorea leprosula]